MPEVAQNFSPAVEAAVATFVQPGPDAMRPDLVAAWKDRFADPSLADDVASNPRLAPRLASSICESLGQPERLDTLPDVDKPVVAALMIHGHARVAELAGCMWHRATILEWITWNSLGTHLPDLDFGLLRTCLRKIPADIAAGMGAPDKAIPDLAREDLLETGAGCLTSWILTAPDDVATRLSLFMSGEDSVPVQNGAKLLVPLADCLIEVAS